MHSQRGKKKIFSVRQENREKMLFWHQRCERERKMKKKKNTFGTEKIWLKCKRKIFVITFLVYFQKSFSNFIFLLFPPLSHDLLIKILSHLYPTVLNVKVDSERFFSDVLRKLKWENIWDVVAKLGRISSN